MKKYIFIVISLLLVVAKPSFSQDKTKPDYSEQATTPKEEKSITHHSIVIDNKNANYTGIAGTINIRDNNDSVTASIDYFAYILDNVKDISHRPIFICLQTVDRVHLLYGCTWGLWVQKLSSNN